MRKSRQFPLKGKPTFAIIGDGECELWYFQMMKRNERSLRIDLKPELPQKKKLSEQFAQVIQYANDYDKVFWVVDFDTIINQSRKPAKGQKSLLQEFKECSTIIEKIKNVTIVINNPCLEFWLLLHFEATGKYFNNCESAAKKLTKHLTDYEKTEKFYTKHNDIYKTLKPQLQTAIKNAKKLGKFNLNNPHAATAQMHLIFETIK